MKFVHNFLGYPAWQQTHRGKTITSATLTSCMGDRHNMPPPASWPCDLESGVQVTRDAGNLCANFSLLVPLCSRLRPNVRDRHTSDRQTSDAHHCL